MSDAHEGCQAFHSNCSGENCWFFALYKQGFVAREDMSLKDRLVIRECLRLTGEALEAEANQKNAEAELYEWKTRRLGELHPVLYDIIALAHEKEHDGGIRSFLIDEKGMDFDKVTELKTLLEEFLSETERFDRIPSEGNEGMDNHADPRRVRLIELLDECANRLFGD